MFMKRSGVLMPIFSLPSPLFVKGNVLVKYIPQYGVKELVIPDSISEIGEAAFRNTELERIVLPNTIKTIGKNAFRETALKEIIIPNLVRCGAIPKKDQQLWNWRRIHSRAVQNSKLLYCPE